MGKLFKKVISTKAAPQTTLPLSQANVVGQNVYVSGCVGFALGSGKLVPGGAREQTEAALTHMKNILIASGSDMSKVVKTTIYIQDFNDFAAVNDAYRQAFVSNFPARTCIQVAKLPMNALVEIEGIAFIGDSSVNNSNEGIHVQSKFAIFATKQSNKEFFSRNLN